MKTIEIFKQQVSALKELKKMYESGIITKELYEAGCQQINQKTAEMLCD